MAVNVFEMLQMSCFCERFIIWNGYVCKENQRWTKLPEGGERPPPP